MRARPSLISIRRSIRKFRALLPYAAMGLVIFAAISLDSSSAFSLITDGVGIDEHLGAQLPIEQLKFRDENGNLVPLSTYFHHGRPVILTMVYYECPNLCTFVLNGLVDGAKELRKSLGWTTGERFDIVVVSINPQETPKLASRKKAAYLEAYQQGHPAEGWHFLTGEQSQIRELASRIGFGYRAVGSSGKTQFAHSSAIYVLTSGGKIARYLYGIEYRPRDLRLALLEASDKKVGTLANLKDEFVSFFYRYDPRVRHYEPAMKRIVAMGCGTGGAGTILILGGFLAVLGPRRERARNKEKERD